MAVGSPIGPPLARRIGTEAAITVLGLTLAAGILIRLIDGVIPLFLGTIVAGLGIALGNVLVPSLIKRDFPDRVGPMTGGYTMAISASGAIAAAFTVPFEDAIGRGWQWGLAVWALPAIAAALIWLPWVSLHGVATGEAPPVSLPVAQPARVAGHRLHGPAVAALLQRAVVAPDAAARARHRPRGGGSAAVGDAAGRACPRA